MGILHTINAIRLNAGARFREFQLTIKEFKANARNSKDAKESMYKNGMLIQVHRLEKGLGLKNVEPGHSKDVALNVLKRLKEYLELGYDINAFAFKESYAVYCAYVDYQQEYGSPDWPALKTLIDGKKELESRIGEQMSQLILANLKAGAHIVSLDTLNEGKRFDFDAFISSRHSMRMYKEAPIAKEDLYKAIEMANKAPSACNRQPTYVYFANRKEKVSKIDSLITGSDGFKGQTPNYLLVSVDRAQFKNEEQFQWYINGGIYVSFLVLALHSLGIGSCIMQWKAFHPNEQKLKEYAHISKNEAIICVIGCGYYDQDTRCIHAQRKAVEDTLIEI